jgi:phosphatidylserine/phosphatidylglycerophosphate/cardiolipin synthase-like enzyme
MIWLLLSLAQANVYFSSDTLIQKLKSRIDAAQSSIDVCFYNLDSSLIVQALIAARNDRQVRVRVITEDSRLGKSWIAALRQEGIPVWTDSVGPGRSNLMHNKFAVFDYLDADPANDWLWTGSFNVSAGDFHADNAIEVQDSGLAHAYTQEFEQMWGGSDSLPNPAQAEFHSGKTDRLSRHWFVAGSDTFRVHFSPQDDPVDTLARLVAQAQSEVGFCIYSFTYRDLALAMKERNEHGVWVGGVFDRSESTASSSYFDSLRYWGIPVYTDKFLAPANFLHEKIMTIDQRIAAAGSVNWSNAGNNSNDENSLIVYSPGIAQRYRSEIIQRLTEAGGAYNPVWERCRDIPLGPRNRRVKAGGALAYSSQLTADGLESRSRAVSRDASGGSAATPRAGSGVIYALKGNNTCEFYRYDPARDEWTPLESIPALSDTWHTTRVRNGATLASAGDAIYATKGANTLEFWRYQPQTQTGTRSGTVPPAQLRPSSAYPWSRLADVPAGSASLRYGASAAAVSIGLATYIYLLKSSNTQEFYRYNTFSNAWERMADPPSGLSHAPFKDGSGIVGDGSSTVYVLKGFYNEFFAYDIFTNTWSSRAGLPMTGRSGPRKRAGPGASLACHRGEVYAAKGGGTSELWTYDCATDRWTQNDDLPFGSGSRVGKGGAIVVAEADNALYAARGSNTLEFYRYWPLGSAKEYDRDLIRIASPPPFRGAATVRYALPRSGKVRFVLYDVTGKLVTTLVQGYHTAGSSSFIVNRSSFARGVYLLRLETETGTTTQKLILE